MLPHSEGWVSLPEAARRSHRSWHRVWRLALIGAVESRRTENRRWEVSVSSIEAFLKRESIAQKVEASV